MSRLQPAHFVDTIIGNNKFTVTACDGLFAVLYKGIPINFRRDHAYIDGQPYYKRTVFVIEGTAHMLARKLNSLFHCSDFVVYALVPGELRPDSTR